MFGMKCCLHPKCLVKAVLEYRSQLIVQTWIPYGIPGAEVEVVHDPEGDLEHDGGDGGQEVHRLPTEVPDILRH